MDLWLRGEKDELINAGLVAVVRIQRDQGAHSLIATTQGGGTVCLVRGAESECRRRLEEIRNELIKVGVRFA